MNASARIETTELSGPDSAKWSHFRVSDDAPGGRLRGGAADSARFPCTAAITAQQLCNSGAAALPGGGPGRKC